VPEPGARAGGGGGAAARPGRRPGQPRPAPGHTAGSSPGEHSPSRALCGIHE
ncbi:unnamed protein product, partial [Heterosigma akashiwo]